MLKLDEGYLYGLGAFETIAVRAGRALFLEQHLQRLKAALAFLKIDQTVTAAEIGNFIKTEKIIDGALKIMVSECNVRLVKRSNPYRQSDYDRGLDLVYSKIRRNESSPFVYHKTLNYGDCIIAKRQASLQGKDEALFLNSHGEICEGTCSNIFFVRAGGIYTPARSCGLLPGIIRSYVCSNYQTKEVSIRPEEIGDYEECFVTNSLMGIMPVRQIGEVSFDEQKIIKRITADYFRFIS